MEQPAVALLGKDFSLVRTESHPRRRCQWCLKSWKRRHLTEALISASRTWHLVGRRGRQVATHHSARSVHSSSPSFRHWTTLGLSLCCRVGTTASGSSSAFSLALPLRPARCSPGLQQLLGRGAVWGRSRRARRSGRCPRPSSSSGSRGAQRKDAGHRCCRRCDRPPRSLSSDRGCDGRSDERRQPPWLLRGLRRAPLSSAARGARSAPSQNGLEPKA